jgi:hypothetical protein
VPLPLIAEIVLNNIAGSAHVMAVLVCGGLCVVWADQAGAKILPLFAGLCGFAAYCVTALDRLGAVEPLEKIARRLNRHVG